MKACQYLLCAMAIGILGCSSDPDTVTEEAADIPKPAEVKVAATTDDVLLMAEYIILSDLVRIHIDRPMNDTVTIAKLAGQVDLFQENVGAAMIKAQVTYMHDVFAKALVPLQQFAVSARNPVVRKSSDELAKRVQQVTNQYYRAVALLEDPSQASQSDMQQVGMLVSGVPMSITNLSEMSREAALAARRALGR